MGEKTKKLWISSNKKKKKKDIWKTLENETHQLTRPQEEAKPTKAEDPQKMRHLNIYRRTINNKSFSSIDIDKCTTPSNGSCLLSPLNQSKPQKRNIELELQWEKGKGKRTTLLMNLSCSSACLAILTACLESICLVCTACLDSISFIWPKTKTDPTS